MLLVDTTINIGKLQLLTMIYKLMIILAYDVCPHILKVSDVCSLSGVSICATVKTWSSWYGHPDIHLSKRHTY